MSLSPLVAVAFAMAQFCRPILAMPEAQVFDLSWLELSRTHTWWWLLLDESSPRGDSPVRGPVLRGGSGGSYGFKTLNPKR